MKKVKYIFCDKDDGDLWTIEAWAGPDGLVLVTEEQGDLDSARTVVLSKETAQAFVVHLQSEISKLEDNG